MVSPSLLHVIVNSLLNEPVSLSNCLRRQGGRQRTLRVWQHVFFVVDISVESCWRLVFSAAAVHVEGVHVHTQPVNYYLINRSSKNFACLIFTDKGIYEINLTVKFARSTVHT